MNDTTTKPASPLAVTIASILVPGLGYWLLGQRKRALIAGGGILLLFTLGILIAGIRVINLPGYEDGYKKYIGINGQLFTERTGDPRTGRWLLLHSPIPQLGENISFLGQVFNGPLCLVAGHLSNLAARAEVSKSYTRLADIGSLYTAVSGMLNLMLIVDAYSRASRASRAPGPTGPSRITRRGPQS